MTYTDGELDAFVDKLLEVRRRRTQKSFTEAERKEIALSIGLTEEDWQAFHRDFDGYLARGHGFRQHQNWDDAIREYTGAFIIDADNEEVLQGLATSHFQRYASGRREAEYYAADKYARLLLEVNPKNQKGLRIIGKLKKGPTRANDKRWIWLVITILILAILAWLFLT